MECWSFAECWDVDLPHHELKISEEGASNGCPDRPIDRIDLPVKKGGVSRATWITIRQTRGFRAQCPLGAEGPHGMERGSSHVRSAQLWHALLLH